MASCLRCRVGLCIRKRSLICIPHVSCIRCFRSVPICLYIADGEVWKTQALAETLDADRSLLGRALTKLQQHDEILKVKRGEYRLAEVD